MAHKHKRTTNGHQVQIQQIRRGVFGQQGNLKMNTVFLFKKHVLFEKQILKTLPTKTWLLNTSLNDVFQKLLQFW